MKRPSSSSSLSSFAPPLKSSSSSLSSSMFHGIIVIVWIVVLLFGWHTLERSNSRLHYYQSASSIRGGVAHQEKKLLLQPADFHFCHVPKLHFSPNSNGASSDTSSSTTVSLLYQCSGPPYDRFAQELYSFVRETTTTKNGNRQNSTISSSSPSSSSLPFWGKREYPIPDNKSVLLLGNSHLRQVSKTLLCQYAHQIESIELLRGDSFVLKFTNNATWISVTNTVLVYSQDWLSWIDDEFVQSPSLLEESTLPLEERMDAVIFGKFTSYQEALNTNFEHMMQDEQDYYNHRQQRRRNLGKKKKKIKKEKKNKKQMDHVVVPKNYSQISFATIAPPTVLDAAKLFPNPIVSVSMFSTADIPRFESSRQEYWNFRQETSTKNNTTTRNTHDHVSFINSRAYIDTIGLECGSDDKLVMGTCHEPGDIIPNSNRNPSNMHRCAGQYGGHADLIAWDVIERLYKVLQ